MEEIRRRKVCQLAMVAQNPWGNVERKLPSESESKHAHTFFLAVTLPIGIIMNVQQELGYLEILFGPLARGYGQFDGIWTNQKWKWYGKTCMWLIPMREKKWQSRTMMLRVIPNQRLLVEIKWSLRTKPNCQLVSRRGRS